MEAANNFQQGKGKSPYAKYGKREYLYSKEYHEWRNAVMGKTKESASRLGAIHTARYMRPVRPEMAMAA